MEPPAEADVDLSEIFSMDKIAYNARNVNYCRVFVAILSGATSGIMGLEGLMGFIAFFASTMVLSLGMYLKMNSDPKPFFKRGGDVWTEGIGQALMSYVMFWTLFFDIVHIY
eukprot:CAMPEP_0119059646 /NCGR_PEP_ID=MMETSP1178-20130426/3733_1 /TAXON_ID=33656 /ORGANISM="unid sp, Strain CCMP2000" /LENGTH=111 /DNA_ID=CAMNT_0007040691 /DNA_START=116 /DNA_END=451 /DNA_ORIENTATION=-